MQIFLASRSPRRKELLGLAGIRFKVFVPKAHEIASPLILKTESPSKHVKRIARAKALAAVKELTLLGKKSGLVLAADTLVFLGNKVLTKPKNEGDAQRMLRSLSGKKHDVYTAIVCLSLSEINERHEYAYRTEVTFHEVSDEWIRWYVSTGEPMDKAGAYGAQGAGCALVKSIKGSYTNVVGLPLGETISLIEKASKMDRMKWIR